MLYSYYIFASINNACCMRQIFLFVLEDEDAYCKEISILLWSRLHYFFSSLWNQTIHVMQDTPQWWQKREKLCATIDSRWNVLHSGLVLLAIYTPSFSLTCSFSFLFPFKHLLFCQKMEHLSQKLEDHNSWHGDEDLEQPSYMFRTYKIRFYGLAVIGLSNIASSINWLSVAIVPDYADAFFGGVGLTTINWFSNIFMLCYLFAGPVSSWVYDHWSVKTGVGQLIFVKFFFLIPLYFHVAHNW